MRKMKDSGIEWIGEIPESWECSKAKYYIQITNGSDPKTEGDVPVYGSGSGCFKTCGESKEGPAVLLGRKGTVDIPRYVEGKYWNVDTAFDVKTDENKMLLKYYFYLSTCFDYRFYTATTTLPSMTQTSYENIFIPVPTVTIQRKVVQYIETKCAEIDAIIAAKEKTNELLKERRQSIIYEAVTKGLDPTVPMKDSGIEWIGEIPENAQIIRLKYLCKIFGRIGFRGYTQADLVSEGEGPITLSPSNITEIGMDYSKCTYLTWEKYDESPEIQIHNNDILLVKTGSSYGKSAIVTDLPMEATINPQFVVIKEIVCNPKFLYYVMQTKMFEYQVEQAVVGGTIPTMAQEKINNFCITLPSVTECEKIVDYLDAKCTEFDILISANNSTIEKLKEYRQSVIYEAVTGKIEI